MTTLRGKRITLIMPTFWDVIAPPMGLAALQAWLVPRGHQVRVFNLNANPTLFSTQPRYLEALARLVPYRALLPRIGSELLGLHLCAKVFQKDAPKEYRPFVRFLMDDYLAPFLGGVAQEVMEALIDRLDGILEAHLNGIRQIVPSLLVGEPDVVGCTVLSSTMASALMLLREIKKQHPDVITLVGGPGPYNGISATSANMQRFAEKCWFVDKVFFGEGEVALAHYLSEGHNGAKVVTARDMNLGTLDMDDLPIPDYTGLDTRRYLNLGLGASRGCPFHCAFCAETKVWGRFRKLSTEKIFNSLDIQVRQYSRRNFFFTDSLLNHAITPLSEALLVHQKDIEFDCYLRVDHQSQNKTQPALWAQAGLGRARLGMESASPALLKIMQKGITPDQQARTLLHLSQANIRTTTYWIVGHPYETESDFEATLDFISINRENIYEADVAVFFFYGDGEGGTDTFAQAFGGLTQRFPSSFEPLTLCRYYKLRHPQPTRVEALNRAFRFVRHMKTIGVPCNRSTAQDYLLNERRWAKLVAEHSSSAAQM